MAAKAGLARRQNDFCEMPAWGIGYFLKESTETLAANFCRPGGAHVAVSEAAVLRLRVHLEGDRLSGSTWSLIKKGVRRNPLESGDAAAALLGFESGA